MRWAGHVARIGEKREIHIGFWWESRKEREHYEDLDVSGRIILKMDLREIGLGGMDWIDLDQDRNQLGAVVNTEMNLRIP
jgi:hypothetical protein